MESQTVGQFAHAWCFTVEVVEYLVKDGYIDIADEEGILYVTKSSRVRFALYCHWAPLFEAWVRDGMEESSKNA